MDHQELTNLIRKGEGQTVEFKETTGTLPAALHTLSAFASQPLGGVIVIGVRDDGQFCKNFSIGARTQEDLAQAIKQQVISMTSGHPLLPTIHRFDNPDVLVVEVPPGTNVHGPYLAYGELWQRSGATTNKVQVDYRQLAKAYHKHLYDDASPELLNYRFCPKCGGGRLQGSSAVDDRHDRIYYLIECIECGWSDWSE